MTEESQYIKGEIIFLTDFTKFQINQENIFHLIAINFKMLTAMRTLVSKKEQRGDRNAVFEYLSLLVKNSQYKTPLDIAVANESPKCIEIMLNMLNEMPDYNFGKLTDHHFNKFFEMGTKVFDDFLGNCFF